MDAQKSPEHLPSRVIYEVTQLCNYDCPHCISRVEKPYQRGPSVEEIVKIGKKCVDEGISSISWTGGEPYLRKDFLEALEKIVNYDSFNKVIQTVDTNGSLITQNIANQSKPLFSLARVSIYGPKPNFYQATGLNSNSRYSHQDAFNGIDNFLNAGLNVQINLPVYDIQSLNDSINEIHKRWKGNSLIEEIVYIPRIQSINQDKTYYPSKEEIFDYVSNIKTNFPIRIFQWKPGKHMVIKADNKVYAHPVFGKPGGLLLIGDALTKSIEELWRLFPDNFKKDHRDLTPSVDHLKG